MPLPDKISDISSEKMNRLYDDARNRWSGVYNEFTRGNRNLYEMLQSVCVFHHEACLNRESYIEALRAVGIKPRDETYRGLIMYTLKLIFGTYAAAYEVMDDETREEIGKMAVYITRWSQALMHCIDQAVPADEIADYLENNGGVHAVSKITEKASVKPTSQNDVVTSWKQISATPLFKKKLPKNSKLKPGKIILVGEISDDGELVVMSEVPMGEAGMNKLIVKTSNSYKL